MTHYSKPPILTFIIILFSISLLKTISAQDEEKTNSLKLLPATQEVIDFTKKSLEKCPPISKSNIITEGINSNGIYTVIGDLFDNKESNALIDYHVITGKDEYGNNIHHGGIIFAKWNGKNWISAGYIDFEPNWCKHYDGRQPNIDKPFWIMKLDNHPICSISSYEEKEGQNYICLILSKNGDFILDQIDSFSQTPNVKNGYLITGDASRVKATTEITYYSKIIDNHFKTIIETGSYCPYTQPGEHPEDSSFPGIDNIEGVDVSWMQKGEFIYHITDNYKSTNQFPNYFIFKSNIKDGSFTGGWREIVENSRTLKPFAEISYTGKNDIKKFIYQKISGLQKGLFEFPVIPRSKLKAQLKVIGSPEAVKLLSP